MNKISPIHFHCHQFLLSPAFGRDHATPTTNKHEGSIKIFTESSLKSHQYARRGIDFILIYVDEAHPEDSGDFTAESGALMMKQPTSIEERLDNASVLAEWTKIPIYVDTVDNWGESLYGAYPER